MKTSFNKEYISRQKRYANVSMHEEVAGRSRRKTNLQGLKNLHGIEPLIQATNLDNILIDLDERKARHLYKLIKRLIDIVVSLAIIIFALPIFLCIVIYIRKRSSSTAIFKQIRIKRNQRNNGTNRSTNRYYLDPKSEVLFKDRRKHKDVFRASISERRKSNPGKAYYLCPKDGKIKPDRRKIDLVGRPFTFYKFRTMYPDAKERFPGLYSYRYTKEAIQHMKFKIENDPRVPKWAKWLRRSSLDELPNFINVLRGDLSLVGPRPDIPEMMKYYSDKQRMKLSVKPGITGLAQMSGRGDLQFQETLKCDLEYVKNQSLLFDAKIVVRTIARVLHSVGAY